MASEHKGWIGVDLDGTLAQYDTWRGVGHIGEPVPAMLARVKQWLAEGQEVKIFTARVSPVAVHLNGGSLADSLKPIMDWCKLHLGEIIAVTHEKDMAMTQLWDDRAVQVQPNTGLRVDAISNASGIEKEVCEDIARRQQLGIAKYGQTVANNPLELRAWLVHGFEEALDMAVYLKRAIAEIDARDESKEYLGMIRDWLKSGCTLTATDVKAPVLEKVGDRFIGGMTIDCSCAKIEKSEADQT